MTLTPAWLHYTAAFLSHSGRTRADTSLEGRGLPAHADKQRGRGEERRAGSWISLTPTCAKEAASDGKYVSRGLQGYSEEETEARTHARTDTFKHKKKGSGLLVQGEVRC